MKKEEKRNSIPEETAAEPAERRGSRNGERRQET